MFIANSEAKRIIEIQTCKDARSIVNRKRNQYYNKSDNIYSIRQYIPLKITIQNPQGNHEIPNYINITEQYKTEDISSSDEFKIKVSNFPPSVTNDDIIKLFEKIGEIKNYKSYGLGLIEFVYKEKQHAIKAINEYNNKKIDGIPLLIQPVFFINSSSNKPIVKKTNIRILKHLSLNQMKKNKIKILKHLKVNCPVFLV
ncbi:uncharacterized protein LOC135931445 [Gordionus sp. m RMFG-2023]|uniref:uncharacterized protein LOC135931445 n=1 Tax=Gordionus sp. m RMFG-2023 TaxID=3053472 RepID=UPI0031FD7F17